MFNREYNFKGIHARYVTELTAELDSDKKFKLFDRNIDVLLTAPIVGLIYGRKSNKDESGQVTVDNIKKINFEQLNKEESKLEYNYQLIMLIHDKKSLPIEERLNRAFRYSDGSPEKEECYQIYEQYILGGIEVLHEKLIENNNPISIDDYLANIYYFIQEYKERNEEVMTEEDIINNIINN